jgi:hypothetical protein
MAKSKEKLSPMFEMLDEKPEKILFTTYQTEPFTADSIGSAAILREKLNVMDAQGYDFYGIISGSTESILIFKIRSRKEL